MNAPMVLTDKVLPKEIKNYVLADVTKEAKLFALGGEAVVTNDIVNYIKANKGQGSETQNPEIPPANPEVPPVNPEVPPVNPGVPGGGIGVPTEPVKVNSAYLKDDSGDIVNGTIVNGQNGQSGEVTINIPSNFNGKFTEIMVSTSKNIQSAVIGPKSISEEKMKEIYSDRRNMNLITYLRKEMQLDLEEDGLSPASVKLLNYTTIKLIADDNSSVTYTLIIN
ncbi:hypothetical protein SDC9_106043 [bioreactor metagenome]|uniref:Uncharacterized protein n=1 Tax=bioreactor metagenome TaxID=1076179 RepID=A0A645B7R7_9ZZZZ